MTVHEIINDIVRRTRFMQPVETRKGRTGRPPKVDEPFLEHFSRKK